MEGGVFRLLFWYGFLIGWWAGVRARATPVLTCLFEFARSDDCIEQL